MEQVGPQHSSSGRPCLRLTARRTWVPYAVMMQGAQIQEQHGEQNTQARRLAQRMTVHCKYHCFWKRRPRMPFCSATSAWAQRAHQQA